MSTRRNGINSGMLLVSIIAHALLIGTLVTMSLFRGCADDSPTTMPMELLVDLPQNDSRDPNAKELHDDPAPLKKEETKKPAPPPDKDDVPASDKEAEPKKAPPPKKKPEARKPDPSPRKIEISKKLIKRGGPAGSGKSKLSAAEVQRLLDRGAKIGKNTLSETDLRRLLNSDTRFGDGKSITQEAVYLDAIKQTMYRAWDQPTSLGIAGLVAKVEFSFSADGSISGCRLTAPSGNATMDESVMHAAKSVPRINGIPVTFFASHRRITVAFELTGGN
jgi:protein TonB